MKTTSKTTLTTLALWLSLLLLAGCVISVDDALPYTRLPQITLASPVRLVASPSHPTSYLLSDPIPAGSRVQVIGADENMAWLLVLHSKTLGWMPTFFSRTNVAKLQTAITFEPPTGNCIDYLGTITDLTRKWHEGRSESVTVVGSILRPDAADDFNDAALSLKLTGPGAVTSSDFIHTPLTTKSALILFTYSIEGLGKTSAIGFDLTKTGGEDVNFQAAFFGNTCPEIHSTLNVGMPRSLLQESKTRSQTAAALESKPISGTVIIKHRTGVETVPVSELGDTIPWLPLPARRPAVGYYGFNVNMPPFDNVLVRQAFAYATNREALLRALDNDNDTPATSFTHPDTLGQDLYGIVGYQFNPSRARSLLRKAGYPNGVGFPEVTLTYYDGHSNSTFAESVSYSWQTVLGVKVKLAPIGDWQDYWNTISRDNPYHVFGSGWGADYNDPDNFLFPLFHSRGNNNYTGIASQVVDKLLEDAAMIEGDPGARQKLYIQAEITILEDEAAVIPLVHYYSSP